MTAANDAIKLLFGVCLYHFYILQYFEEVPKHHSRFRMQQVSDKLHKVSLGKAGAQSSTVSVYLVTWNVGATGPPKDLVELLDLKAKQLPDIYGIGFQEMDPSDGDDKENQWTSRLTDVLGQMNYVRIKVVRMQAISLQVFVRRPLLLNVTSIESEYSKAGMGGWWGNKGGVSVRFDVGGVNLIIVNTHLAAHMENMAERIEDFNTVLKTQRFRDPDVENILDHDYVFWMGDLNCRLEGISRDRAVELTQQNRLEELFKLDQLKQAQQEGLMLVDFQEGPLNFKPTYKFDKDTDVYDTSEKQRVPAWCDRILWRAHTDLDGLKVQQRKYFSPAYNRGDHKPVTATFLVNPLHYRSHVSYLQSDHKPISGAFDVKVFNEEAYPFVTFDVISKWKYGVDAKFHYSVRKGIEPDTSPWDWIALLPATFKHLDDYKIYVYGKNNAEDIKGGVTLEFSGNDLKVPPGKYQLGYISKHKNWLRGLSNEFEIVA